ncbi:MAG: PQQ-binding-like beta-propeller repeat protein, partial [Terracidiphilus sp.]
MRIAKYALVLAVLLATAAIGTLAQDVPYQKILHSDDEPQNWLTYGGNYQSQRFSRLKKIDTKNVSQLKVAWIYQPARAVSNVETSPIVVDGIMYVTEPPSTVTAIDARTGLRIWSWSPKMPEHLVLIGLYGNSRGVAILDKTVYVGTADAHLVALDAKTGGVEWDVHVADNRFGYSMSGPPLAIDGKVIVGTGGSEAAVRG